jgi:PAS domain S-box-containing protein
VAAVRPDLILPDLILMDIQLAGEMDGITAAGRICSVTDVPVVFLTAFSQDPLLQRAKAIAPYGYLIKPVSLRELTATLEMALYKHLLDRQLKEINNELCLALVELKEAREDLEKKVQERTQELQKTNEMLTAEIEKRMKSEETLQKSQAQYRLLSEHTTDAVWLMDMNLNIIYHSSSVEMLRGFTVQEVMEIPFEQRVAPESLKLAFKVFSEEIPKVEADPGYNPARTLELEYYCKDGSIMLVESKFSIVRDESGRPVSILGEARDIRERKRAEEVLRQSEARFKNLLQDVQSVAVQGYAVDGTTQYWNQASEQLYGESRTTDCGVHGRTAKAYG